LTVGLTIQSALAQGGNRGVVMMNHLGVNVPDIPQAVSYYTEKMGYKEAFRVTGDNGQPTLVYMQISQNTFLELNQANAQRPAGVTHYGLVVDKAVDAVRMFRERGLMVSDATLSAGTKAVLANITDPYMGRIELVEITPESAHRKAINAWK
jgi:catechol 2,3-dioxygenase-like lactoylglutathione lyase family enzyme